MGVRHKAKNQIHQSGVTQQQSRFVIGSEAKGLDGLILTRKGNRLSIMPIEKKHWDKLPLRKHKYWTGNAIWAG